MAVTSGEEGKVGVGREGRAGSGKSTVDVQSGEHNLLSPGMNGKLPIFTRHYVQEVSFSRV